MKCSNLPPELLLEPVPRHDGEKLVQGHELEGVLYAGAQIVEDELDVRLLGFSQGLHQGGDGGGIDAGQVPAVDGDDGRLFH